MWAGFWRLPPAREPRAPHCRTFVVEAPTRTDSPLRYTRPNVYHSFGVKWFSTRLTKSLHKKMVATASKTIAVLMFERTRAGVRSLEAAGGCLSFSEGAEAVEQESDMYDLRGPIALEHTKEGRGQGVWTHFGAAKPRVVHLFGQGGVAGSRAAHVCAPHKTRICC